MLRVGKGIFGTSLLPISSARRVLRHRRSALGRVPQRVMNSTFSTIGRLLDVSQLDVTMCGRAARGLRCASGPIRSATISRLPV